MVCPHMILQMKNIHHYFFLLLLTKDLPHFKCSFFFTNKIFMGSLSNSDSTPLKMFVKNSECLGMIQNLIFKIIIHTSTKMHLFSLSFSKIINENNKDNLKLCPDDAIFRSINRMRFGWKSHASYRKSHALCNQFCRLSTRCVSVASRLPWDGINLLGNTVRQLFANVA